MALDSTPWLIGGGATHSPEVARNLAYAACGGNEGVVGSKDFKIIPFGTPGAGVTALPGTAFILNRSVGGDQQAYTARASTATNVTVSPNTTGAARSDLVVLRVEDPFMAGVSWPTPSDPTAATYNYLRIIQDVPAGTTSIRQLGGSDSAITLARIDWPANTATVTAGMITDLRKISNSVRDTFIGTCLPTAESKLTPGGGFANWPPQAVWQTRIPEWATHMTVVGTVSGIKLKRASTSAAGSGRVLVRVVVSSAILATEPVELDMDVQPTQQFVRDVGRSVGTLYIPESLRGQTVSFSLQGRRQPSSVSPQAGDLVVDQWSSADLSLNFMIRPE